CGLSTEEGDYNHRRLPYVLLNFLCNPWRKFRRTWSKAGRYWLWVGFLKKALSSCLLICCPALERISSISSSRRFKAIFSFRKIMLLFNCFSGSICLPSCFPLL